MGQVIVPEWKTQTGVGVDVAVAESGGRLVSVGGTGVGEIRVRVNVSVDTLEGKTELFDILQPEIIIIISRKSKNLWHRVIDIPT
jgi:hypothetical protein